MNFIIYDNTGKILRAGFCSDEDFALQAQDGEFILEGAANPDKDAVDVYSKEVIYGGRVIPAPTPQSYGAARRKLYPSVEDQLDMLWHGMDSGVLPKVEPFYSINAAVKQSVPKPTEDFVFEVGSV